MVLLKEEIPFEGLIKDKFIDYKDYFGAAIEVDSIQFYMLSETRQNSYIDTVESAFKTISPDTFSGDGIHPNTTGHGVIKDEWIKAFNKLGL